MRSAIFSITDGDLQEYYEVLEEEYHTGMLIMKIGAIKEQFQPAPSLCISQIQELLPKLAFETNQKLALKVPQVLCWAGVMSSVGGRWRQGCSS